MKRQSPKRHPNKLNFICLQLCYNSNISRLAELPSDSPRLENKIPVLTGHPGDETKRPQHSERSQGFHVKASPLLLHWGLHPTDVVDEVHNYGKQPVLTATKQTARKMCDC